MPHVLSSGLPKDFLRPCLLLLLREGDAHGYQLLEQLDTFGFDHSDPGSLYRALRRLETDGFVTSSWEPSGTGPPKRVYGLSEEGVAELDRRATDLAEGERRIDAFLDRYLRARRLPGTSPKRRGLTGRMAAHRASAQKRERLQPPAGT